MSLEKEEVANAMRFLLENENLKNYVKNFDGERGFLWTFSEELSQIKLALSNDTNSPLSLALVLQECRALLRFSDDENKNH
jgi:hypothetical protein